jgi:hypothetical protein
MRRATYDSKAREISEVSQVIVRGYEGLVVRFLADADLSFAKTPAR